ncbi:CRISPR-associated endonuclease Cas2 [Spirulina sp. CS-785/01]|uniref:CRISPR-associated endonuclease Cas2 n=1 Tax=Spirulina sp. CS-785/01 TaxID=3021716 RepID=UPI00232D5D11|nr:CRISPR-associated endonuclease Cas2 [Spirulina sp. CS-785/01]MDB9311776.1 CRISPR-associated endonuclease Cas2 [Spirulina sp. CS-785/01]
MAERHYWYLVAYDIRSPKRWRRAYKIITGYGDRVQYSLFRCWLTQRQREKLRWQLEEVLTEEDDLLLIQLSAQCIRNLALYNRPNAWQQWESGYRIF